MHDVLEGVLHYSVKETLKALMFEKGLFSVDEINKRISSFDYGYHNDLNKPAPLQRSRLTSSDHSIKQHGTKSSWEVQGIISRMSNYPQNALHDTYAKSNFEVHNIFP